MDENEMIEQQTSEEAVNNEPMTLDEALAAARAEVEARESAPEEAPVEEAVPETEAVAEEQAVVEEANAPTEAPIQGNVAPQNDALYQQLQAQNQQLMQQLQVMQQQMAQVTQQAQEINRANAEQVIEAMTTPPTIDFSSIMYASEDEQRAAMDKFVNDTMNYTRQSVMNELKPVIDDFRHREADVQKRNIKDGFRQNSNFSGFQEREQWIEQILDKNPELRNLPLNKQYEIGYLITQGVDAMKAARNPAPAPAPKTVDEMLAEVEGNPELMRALEAKRIKSIAQGQKDNPPPFVAGGGSNRIGLNVPDEPVDFDMAREGAYNFLRGRR